MRANRRDGAYVHGTELSDVGFLEPGAAGDGKIVFTKAGNEQLSKLKIGRRLMQFGPEGFREVPKEYRLVIVMGSNPEKFFAAMDEGLGAVSQAKVDQDNKALSRLLFEALTSTQAEKTLVEAQLEAAQEQFVTSGGNGR